MNEILELIRTNKISTVEVSDALGKKGVLDNVFPINNNKYCAAEVFYTCTWDETNWPLHEQIQSIPKDSVIYIDSINCNNRALIGDIMSKWMLLYQKASGIIVNGYVRDIHRIRKEGYPIWCKGFTPLGCFNKNINANSKVKEYIEKQKKIFNKSILVADDSGCTVIQSQNLTEDFRKRLELIELQEDIWYYCTDTLKMSTFQTICEKDYLKNINLNHPSLSKLQKISDE